MADAEKGVLYLCATPIGNLEDISLRALRILREADYIAAEDTRHTLKLLNHFDISKPLISYHEHNMHEAGKRLIDLLNEGRSIALVSDAGMPGISDPGAELAKEAFANGLAVTVVPGPSAALSALVLSGLPTERFVFEGFLPREKKKRDKRLDKLKNEERTIIFYEAPHRLLSTLSQLEKAFGGSRKVAIIRELTKIYEEIIHTDLKSAVLRYEQTAPKGEFVLVVEGASEPGEDVGFKDLGIKEHIKLYMEAGMNKKEAVKQVARDRGVPKNEVYKYTIEND